METGRVAVYHSCFPFSASTIARSGGADCDAKCNRQRQSCCRFSACLSDGADGEPLVIQTPGWRGSGYSGCFQSLSPPARPGPRCPHGPAPLWARPRGRPCGSGGRQCEGAGPGQGRAPAARPSPPLAAAPSLPPAGGGRVGPRRDPIPPPSVHGLGGRRRRVSPAGRGPEAAARAEPQCGGGASARQR